MAGDTPPDQGDPFEAMMAYPRKSQRDYLKRLKARTRIPIAVLVREAIDLLREKYGDAPPTS